MRYIRNKLMSATSIAIISGIILSVDQILLKLLINIIKDSKILFWINLKALGLSITILLIGCLGLSLWFIALRRTELTNIYWTTSLYYLIVPILSYVILKENITTGQLFGYALISAGALITTF